ncbi:Helix-turn-helix domain-containing protein [Nocardioides sp. YR527]|nr:Helix-turn-helix domain-containing protein [Nocardioides sp. YR527]
MSEQHPSESAKRAFGSRLKRLRLDAGITGVEMAARCGWNKSKVSKIEHGTQAPSDENIRAWAAVCGAERLVPELIAVSREIDQMWHDYKQVHKRGMQNLQLDLMDRYARTKLFRIYEGLNIPGWLQTLDYTRELFTLHAHIHGLPLENVEEAARNRMLRKKFLGTGRPAFVFVMEEYALYSNTGGRDVMGGQLDYLLEVEQMPYVSVGIIPLGQRRSLFPGEAFYLYDETLLRQEYWSASLQTSRPETISHFVRVFDALRDQAVFGAEARGIIDQARHRLR